MISNLLLITLLLCLFTIIFFIYSISIQSKQIAKLNDSNLKLLEEIKKLKSYKKSLEIRMGQITEQIVPFSDKFTHSTEKLRFLGSPIDYVCFEQDQITFIEIKTNKSKESKTQKNIKFLIENNKVKYELLTINTNGDNKQ